MPARNCGNQAAEDPWPLRLDKAGDLGRSGKKIIGIAAGSMHELQRVTQAQ